MTYDFFIKKGATLPYLRMESINDGRHDFSKLNTALQAADVYFTMTDIKSGVKKISNAKADIVKKGDTSCEDKYILEYRWEKRDTNTKGIYKGEFKIVFSNDITDGDYTFPIGQLIVPISQDLIIHITE